MKIWIEKYYIFTQKIPINDQPRAANCLNRMGQYAVCPRELPNPRNDAECVGDIPKDALLMETDPILMQAGLSYFDEP